MGLAALFLSMDLTSLLALVFMATCATEGMIFLVSLDRRLTSRVWVPVLGLVMICLVFVAKIMDVPQNAAFVFVAYLFFQVFEMKSRLSYNDFFGGEDLSRAMADLHADVLPVSKSMLIANVPSMDQVLSFVQYVLGVCRVQPNDVHWASDHAGAAMKCWSFLEELVNEVTLHCYVLSEEQAIIVVDIVVDFLNDFPPSSVLMSERLMLGDCVFRVLEHLLRQSTSAQPKFELSKEDRAQFLMYLLRHGKCTGPVFETQEAQTVLVTDMGAPNFLYATCARNRIPFHILEALHMPCIQSSSTLKQLFVTKLHEVLVHASVQQRKHRLSAKILSQWLSLLEHCHASAASAASAVRYMLTGYTSICIYV